MTNVELQQAIAPLIPSQARLRAYPAQNPV